MEVNMWPAAATIAVVGLVACVALISRRSGSTVDNGVADDRWFMITQWMEDDKKWSDSVGESIAEMADTLDALHVWTDKVSGQLEKIEGCLATKDVVPTHSFGVGMMPPSVKQGGDERAGIQREQEVNYKVIKGLGMPAFQEKCSKFISDGWVPAGGISVLVGMAPGTILIQAMWKPLDKEERDGRNL